MAKKAKVSKKVSKKKTAKKAPTTRSTKHEIVVRVQADNRPTEADIAPITDQSKYMIPKTWMSEKMVVRMVQKTPPQHVFKRKGRSGQIWDYVTGNYVEKVLNFVFGWNWDFEVVNHGKEGDLVWVLGKLTVKDDKGHQIVKSQFGRAEIKYKDKKMMDYGNDLKAATTDALKKCASLLGIASDIYGKTEFKEETGQDVGSSTNNSDTKPKLPAPKEEDISQEEPEYVCRGVVGKGCPYGHDIITKAGHDFSTRIYGKPLCKECAKDTKPKK